LSDDRARKSRSEPATASQKRCAWVGEDPVYVRHHDVEWGVLVYDSRALWEHLVLDGFQAGLSWRTVLLKRDNFRLAFAGFEPEKVARFDAKDIDRLFGRFRNYPFESQDWFCDQQCARLPNAARKWSRVLGVGLEFRWRSINPERLDESGGCADRDATFGGDFKGAEG
jgi:hypothetical protein